MRSFDRCAFTDLTQMGCSDIFELIGLDIINAGRRRSWGQGESGIGVRVGGRVGGGDDGGRRSEFLQWATFSISPVSGRGFRAKRQLKHLGGQEQRRMPCLPRHLKLEWSEVL